mmetsp:Transcript_35167/g.59265  ORF Transcript_35167/g.59265 Transcript_35167/m.59265 type:complete len:90 (-) Transcript_35167:301-570(-)
MLIKKVDVEFPGKFAWTWNDPAVLQATVPAGDGWEGALWRKGAFEVRRMDTNSIMFSKMSAGEHLVDGKGGPESKMALFCSTVLASQIE